MRCLNGFKHFYMVNFKQTEAMLLYLWRDSPDVINDELR